MAFKHYTLTLTAVAQRLSTVLAQQAVAGVDDVSCRQIVFAADPANAAAVYIGSSSGVSSTSHAFSLDPTQASHTPVVLGPFDAGPLRLSDFWVIGANNERLMVGIVPF